MMDSIDIPLPSDTEGNLMRRVRSLEERVRVLEQENAQSLKELGGDIVRLERKLDDVREAMRRLIVSHSIPMRY